MLSESEFCMWSKKIVEPVHEVLEVLFARFGYKQIMRSFLELWWKIRKFVSLNHYLHQQCPDHHCDSIKIVYESNFY